MEWLRALSDVESAVADCLMRENYFFSEHFNALLGEYRIARISIVRRLKSGIHNEEYDYSKGHADSPCFCLDIKATHEEPALSLFVAFSRETEGTLMMWIQEFHLKAK